ncbi:hypothetical protein QTP86_009614 [Hemibagrus guttatus]|nr:hypothetical protein QTP86_009614 [Hemibagrus guttatus]
MRFLNIRLGGEDVSVRLLELRLGVDSAANYVITFRTLAAQSGWNDAALQAVFREGLHPALQAEMACHDIDTALSNYISMAICLDNLRRQHRVNTRPRPQYHRTMEASSPREEVPEPMQLGRACISEEERLRRTERRLCFYCGEPGHQVYRCPERPSKSQVGDQTHLFKVTVPAMLLLTHTSFSVLALIDSRVAVNIIHSSLVEELHLPTMPCNCDGHQQSANWTGISFLPD